LIDSVPIFTIGHSTRTIPDFAALLQAGEVEVIVDVRTIPRSRTNPQYNEDALPGGLKPHGMGYRRIAELGGLRGRSLDVAPELNAFWKNRSFHNYADYALSDAFESGLAELLALAAEHRSAIMCSEAVWWRCHRRVVADVATVLHGVDVRHLMHDGSLRPHPVSEAATVVDGGVQWPAEATD